MMAKYRFKVSGVVEVEAPNIAQAWRYIRKNRGTLGEVARVSAGSGQHCARPNGRNINWRQYWLYARSLPDTKQIEYIKPSNAG